MSTAEVDNFTFILSAGEEKIPLEPNAEGGWSASIIVPREGEITMYYVTTMGGREGKGITPREVKNGIGRQAMTFGGLARWSIV